MFFVVCSGDLRFEVVVDREWLITELSDDGCKLNLSTNLFHRSFRTKHASHSTYTVLSNLRKKQGKNLWYFQILIFIRKKSMDLKKSTK